MAFSEIGKSSHLQEGDVCWLVFLQIDRGICGDFVSPSAWRRVIRCGPKSGETAGRTIFSGRGSTRIVDTGHPLAKLGEVIDWRRPRSNASARVRPIAPMSSGSRSRSPRRLTARRAASSSLTPRRRPAILTTATSGDRHPGDRGADPRKASRASSPTAVIAATTPRPTTRFRVHISGQRRRVTEAIKRELRRRSAVEPVIGHAKTEHPMDRNYLARTHGDAANAVLGAAGYNFRRLLEWALVVPIPGRPRRRLRPAQLYPRQCVSAFFMSDSKPCFRNSRSPALISSSRRSSCGFVRGPRARLETMSLSDLADPAASRAFVAKALRRARNRQSNPRSINDIFRRFAQQCRSPIERGLPAAQHALHREIGLLRVAARGVGFPERA